jgi:hypothetical protein
LEFVSQPETTAKTLFLAEILPIVFTSKEAAIFRLVLFYEGPVLGIKAVHVPTARSQVL